MTKVSPYSKVLKKDIRLSSEEKPKQDIMTVYLSSGRVFKTHNVGRCGRCLKQNYDLAMCDEYGIELDMDGWDHCRCRECLEDTLKVN